MMIDWIEARPNLGVNLFPYNHILLLTSLQTEEEIFGYTPCLILQDTHSTSTSELHYSEKLIIIRFFYFLLYFSIESFLLSSCDIDLIFETLLSFYLFISDIVLHDRLSPYLFTSDIVLFVSFSLNLFLFLVYLILRQFSISQ